MIKAESLEPIKVCIVFRDKHANDRAAVVMFVITFPASGPFQLFNRVLSSTTGSSPVMSRLKADALTEAFFLFVLRV